MAVSVITVTPDYSAIFLDDNVPSATTVEDFTAVPQEFQNVKTVSLAQLRLEEISRVLKRT